MHVLFAAAFLALSFAAPFQDPSDLPNEEAADAVLHEAAEALAALHGVRFHHAIELNYASQGYTYSMGSSGYFDFDAANDLGARFRFENEGSVYAYNGSESFYYDKGEDVLSVTVRPGVADLTGRHFEGSFYTLRRALPLLLTDDGVKTALVSKAGDAYHLVEIRVPRATIAYDGTLSPIQLDVVVTYELAIDKETLLPTQFTKRDPNGDYMRTTLSDVEVEPEPLADGTTPV